MMKKPIVERVSDAIIREVIKWDGVMDYCDMVQAVKTYSLPLSKRLIRMIDKGVK